MITYNPSDPTTEIIFNLENVEYEARKLSAPDASFMLGEWVGLGANETAVKVADLDAVLPAMVYTPTDRHDVAESERITVARGHYFVSTMNYKLSQSFAIGDRLVVNVDGGMGKLEKIGSSDTFTVVGIVRVPPANDGIDRLIAEIYPVPSIIVVA